MKIELIDLIRHLEIDTDSTLFRDFIGDYNLEIEVDELKDIDSYFDSLDDDGKLHEFIDGQIDLYTADLWKWSADNYTYINEAINEGLVDTSNFDMISAIQAGQYVYYRDLVYTSLQTVRDEFNDIEGLETAAEILEFIEENSEGFHEEEFILICNPPSKINYLDIKVNELNTIKENEIEEFKGLLKDLNNTENSSNLINLIAYLVEQNI